MALERATLDVHHGLPWHLRGEGRKQHKTEHQGNEVSIYPHPFHPTPRLISSCLTRCLCPSTFQALYIVGSSPEEKSRVFFFNPSFSLLTFYPTHCFSSVS